ncbi:MAG: hypothetical protein K2Q01_11355, partial [Rickettsiales bacterium]|nr:hypothetical protein [Rickettsiales bacterium]
NSPPAAFLETQAQQEQRKKNAPLHGRPPAPQANWRDRVISAPAQEKEPITPKAKGGDGASLDDYKKPKVERQSEQLAEREAMRKALEELNPPTNAIN